MSDELFPELPGLEWELSKTPIFNTKIMTSVNGRELRASYQGIPKYEISMSYAFLRESKNRGELQILESFFLERRGAFDSFLLKMPEDNQYSCRFIGDGLASKFQLYKVLKTHKPINTTPHYVNPSMWNYYSKNMWSTNDRSQMWNADFIGWWDSEYQTSQIPLNHIEPQYIGLNPDMWNKNVDLSMWFDNSEKFMWNRGVVSVTKDGLIELSEPLANGQELVISGTFYYRCRFKDDEQQYTNFMTKLWKAQKIEMVGSLGKKI